MQRLEQREPEDGGGQDAQHVVSEAELGQLREPRLVSQLVSSLVRKLVGKQVRRLSELLGGSPGTHTACSLVHTHGV